MSKYFFVLTLISVIAAFGFIFFSKRISYAVNNRNCNVNYYKFIRPYEESGVIKELYATKDLSIIKVYNAFYAVVDKNIYLSDGGYFGLESNPKYIDSIIKAGHKAHLKSIMEYGETKLKDYIFSLSDKNLSYSFKEKGIDKITGKFINNEYEEKLQSLNRTFTRPNR